MYSEPSGRLRTRTPVDYTTTGFGAQGYLPGEMRMHYVGSTVKSDYNAQRVATSQGSVAQSRRRQVTLEDVQENVKELV